MNSNSNNNVFNNHPIIRNSNQYFYEKRYVTISSEDRDITKYPNSSEFEILLPQEYLNVASARLYSWSFPANYSVFSITYHNVNLSFKMLELYTPSSEDPDILTKAIYDALAAYGTNKAIIFSIEPGFYNPLQMSVELTNKFNFAITNIVYAFFAEPQNQLPYAAAKLAFDAAGGYQRFKVVYNAVGQKLWFGNEADRFVLDNESDAYLSRFTSSNNCLRKNQLPEWANWGLPPFLGFTKCNATALSVDEYLAEFPAIISTNYAIIDNSKVPRFYYGDAVDGSGDNGYWLVPKLPGATVYCLQAPFKINLMGPAYIYMEIEGWNCIDETSPYNLTMYTTQNNQPNSVVNSCFAKIAVPTTPISQWFDQEQGPYKYWNPPAERLSKMKVKLRYHNGALVEFGLFDYSFTLELNLLRPQQERSYSIVSAYDLGQHQSFSSKYF